MNTDSVAQEREPLPMPSMTAQECVERAAFWLYEAERANDPTLPSWDDREVASHRLDCRYRAQAAYQHGKSPVRSMLVHRIAQTLATADGYIWPSCDNKATLAPETDLQIASRRQLYLHKARHVVATCKQYLEVWAKDESPELRANILSAARAQRDADEQVARDARKAIGRAS